MLRNIILGACAFLLIACSTAEKLPPIPPDGVILAFGDSITFGSGANPEESYPGVLEKLISRRVVNAGAPGEVTSEGLKRLPDILERERPALLILCHGGNDMLQHLDRKATADNLAAMVRLAREHGVPAVLVSVPAPDISLSPPGFYAEIAEEFHIPLEGKALPRILAKGSLKSDYIHPNSAGYRMLAEDLQKLLEKSGAI